MSGFLLDVGMKGWGVINFIQQAFIPLFLQVHLGTEPNRILFPEKGFVIFFFLASWAVSCGQHNHSGSCQGPWDGGDPL